MADEKPVTVTLKGESLGSPWLILRTDTIPEMEAQLQRAAHLMNILGIKNPKAK